MIIHRPKIESTNNEVRISVDIEFEKEHLGIPRTLWFTFSKQYKKFTSLHANGFLLCLLPLAMRLREDVRVEGKISSRLLYNLREYQKILNFWHPEFSIVDINAESYTQKRYLEKRAVMSAFSGGVDSFYTLLSHLPQNEPAEENQISHALFVEGFDRPLSETETFRTLEQSYGQLMNKLGIDLVTVSTNVRNFYVDGSRLSIEWDLCHSAVLIGTALMLEGLMSRFYFPADEVLPAYFNPKDFVDHYSLMIGQLQIPLLSTENVEVVYHGATTPRVEKVQRIAKWEETYERLMVCWETHGGLNNCGKCEKCICTMISLDIFGALKKYKTFSLPLEMNLLRTCTIKKELFCYHEWNLKYALRAGRRDLARNIRYALFMNRVKSFLPMQKPSVHKKME